MTDWKCQECGQKTPMWKYCMGCANKLKVCHIHGVRRDFEGACPVCIDELVSGKYARSNTARQEQNEEKQRQNASATGIGCVVGIITFFIVWSFGSFFFALVVAVVVAGVIAAAPARGMSGTANDTDDSTKQIDN